MPKYKLVMSEPATYIAYSAIMFAFGFLANGDVTFFLPALMVMSFFLWWKFENKQKKLRWNT